MRILEFLVFAACMALMARMLWISFFDWRKEWEDELKRYADSLDGLKDALYDFERTLHERDLLLRELESQLYKRSASVATKLIN